jgi:hypothetical protein
LNRDIELAGSSLRHVSNVLSEEKKQQVIALGRLGWSLRRIERAASCAFDEETMIAEPAIQTAELSKVFRGVTAVSGLNLVVEANRITGFLGRTALARAPLSKCCSR